MLNQSKAEDIYAETVEMRIQIPRIVDQWLRDFGRHPDIDRPAEELASEAVVEWVNQLLEKTLQQMHTPEDPEP